MDGSEAAGHPSFLETAPMVSVADLRASPQRLPHDRGLYELFFGRTPGAAPTSGCLNREGRVLLYIGSAGANLRLNGNLRTRLEDHHPGGNERRSKLSATLAALMPEVAGAVVPKNERGRIKFHTSPEGAARLRQWMDRNIEECWTDDQRPGDSVAALVRPHAPPLNINFGVQPFHADLAEGRAIRRQSDV